MALTIEELIELHGNAKEQFIKLDGARGAVLTRARNAAELTIPSILPAEGHDEEATLDTPYQGLGARLVNNLSSKLLLTLLPPNTSFFRILVDEEVKDSARASGQDEALSEAEAQIVQVEQDALRQVEREALRVPAFEMFKSVIVTGNSLGYKLEKGLKTFRLDQYVVRRDFEGNVLEFITKEDVSIESLDEAMLSELNLDEETKKVVVYTRAILTEGDWIEYQEVEDVTLKGSEKTYKPEKLPYIPLRWTSINGENYGRGLVEQYLGDFRSLEALYQLLIETAAVQARTVFGKKAGGTVDMDDLNDALNGQCILGDLEDEITMLRVDKGNDLATPLSLLQDIKGRLEQAFLAASSVARDSERTTATEIRFMAADLEESLGGVYSILSLEFQLPLARIILDQLETDMDGLDVVIIAGVEALGRNNDLEKLRQFNGLLQELGLPDLVATVLNVENYIHDIANALGLDGKRYIKTQDEVQGDVEQQQENDVVAQGAANVVDEQTKQQ